MSQPIHPSPEQLSAYHDDELPPAEAPRIQSHLTTCGECRTAVADFQGMADLGAAGHEGLPGDSYWLDLPDRILARIAAGDPPAFPEAPRPSWWERLTAPAGAWRVALGATAAVAAVVVGIVAFQGNPAGPDLVAEVAPVADIAPAPATNERPAEYTTRVLRTLGSSRDLGTSLDLQPGQPISPDGDGIGIPVSTGIPPLSAEFRNEAERVVGYGCDLEPSAETAFLVALKAQEQGRFGLAQQGFHLVRQRTDLTSPLHWEAHYRMACNDWRDRLRPLAPQARAESLQELARLAQASYATWTRTGRQLDCLEAYCLNRVYKKLSAEVVEPDDARQTVIRMHSLVHCAN